MEKGEQGGPERGGRDERDEEPLSPAEEASGGGTRPGGEGARRYFLTAFVSGGVLALAVAFFAAGFATHALTDDDVDRAPIEQSLTNLDLRTQAIQQEVGRLGNVAAGGGDEAAEEPQADPGAAVSAASEDDPSWGPADSRVVVVEFSDFQCPYCGRFASQTLGQIRDAYGEQVRFVYRDFPLTGIHANAQKAAEAAQCAHEQGLFWEYHDLLFENQGALTAPDLKSYAEQVGADTGRFNDCLDAGENASEVALDLQDGQQAGVRGTPAFLVNGTLVSGAQPFEVFQQVIDQQLAAAGG